MELEREDRNIIEYIHNIHYSTMKLPVREKMKQRYIGVDDIFHLMMEEEVNKSGVPSV